MKGQRFVSMLLALVLCMGLSVPCLAQDYYDYEERTVRGNTFEKAALSYEKMYFAKQSGGIAEDYVYVLHVMKNSTFTYTSAPLTGYLYCWDEMGCYNGFYNGEVNMGTLCTDGNSIWIEAEDGKYTTNYLFEIDALFRIYDYVGTVFISIDDVSTTPFTDVPSGAYYEDAVLWALNNDITNGTSDTTFAPDMTCTRGQVVTFLWRANGCPAPTTTENPFTDVKESDYFYSAVLWAVENGITNGMSATTFGSGATCTSGQVLTFLWRANGSPAAETTGTEYYATAAAWAEGNGLLGKTDTVFAAENLASRAEIVTYLYYNSVNQEG